MSSNPPPGQDILFPKLSLLISQILQLQKEKQWWKRKFPHGKHGLTWEAGVAGTQSAVGPLKNETLHSRIRCYHLPHFMRTRWVPPQGKLIFKNTFFFTQKISSTVKHRLRGHLIKAHHFNDEEREAWSGSAMAHCGSRRLLCPEFMMVFL